MHYIATTYCKPLFHAHVLGAIIGNKTLAGAYIFLYYVLIFA